jgi:uncharacterized membrane protein YfcA
MPPLVAALCAPLISLLAATVLAVGGFGSALVAIPLLALVLPIKTVVPLVLLQDFLASLLLGIRLRGDIDRREVVRVVPSMLAGITAGVTLLVMVPARGMLFALGTLVVIYGVYTLARGGTPLRLSRRWAIPAGLAGGMVGGAMGVGGPIYVMYYSGRIEDPARLRASMSLTFLVSTGTRVALLAAAGLLLDVQLWGMLALMVPGMLAGLFLGQRIGRRLSRPRVMRLVAAMLVMSGTSVLWKAAAL